MKSFLHLILHNLSMPKYPSECTGGQILNFQNTFDRAWNKIRMKIQKENFFGILISTRLLAIHSLSWVFPQSFQILDPYNFRSVFWALQINLLQVSLFIK
jgi:hypothetical protein